MPIATRRQFLAPLILSLAAAASVAVSGCGHKGTGDASGADTEQCLTTRKYFERDVWSAFMGQTCTKCHTPDGPAVAMNARLVLQPTSYPGWLDANLAKVKEVAQYQVNGQPEILVKPTGGDNHGGGVVLDPNGPEIAALRKFLDMAAKGDQCGDQPSTALAGVTTLDAAATFRKAAIDLGGRLPTDAETAMIAGGKDDKAKEAALDAALDQLLTEDVFYDRLKEMWNDLFLTDKWLQYGGAALDFMDTDKDYPSAAPYKDDKSPQYGDRDKVNRAIAQEPLDLIAYVVRNGRPFTEIVTANYALVNPYSAAAYGVSGQVQFSDPTNESEWHEAQVTLGTGVAIPHAGILTTPSFLNRWNTTPTNLSRGRARRVYKYLLATDVLKIATRPIDPTKVTMEQNPTRNADVCVVCHKVVDPVAGMFRGWDDFNYEDFHPDKVDDAFNLMFEPGFGTTKMDPSYYDSALQWLGGQIAQDPRFAINAVYVTFKGLTGHDPLAFPDDPKAKDFNAHLSAWEAQDAFFSKVQQDFVKGSFDLKIVVKEIVESPYYRADGLSRDPADGDDALLDGVGTGRLLTPEMLNRKIMAVTGGIHWRSQWGWDDPPGAHDLLLDDGEYLITYGGIDSDTVPTRLTEPNGVVAAVAHRMSDELACHLTAYDFTRPQDQRRFFPLVDPTEVPESAGHTVDGSVADIKKNIQYLHKLVLGEDLPDGDPEIDRTYGVFLDTWHELSQAGDKDIPWECQGRIDPTNGMDLPDDQKISKDDTFAIRSWQAVLNYLLLDYKFLYE